MKLDVLAFGVHPDDVELGCAGTLLVAIAEGKKVGIIDLTQGELGTRGTAETRKIEATNAAEILGVHVRENLKMADGFFQNDEQHQRKIIETIRKYQPTVILCNAPEDRHPDHGRSAKLVSDAAFLSGLRKIVTNYDGKMQDAWRPTYVFHYIQARYLKPDFIVDISAYHEIKLKSILAYTTQFHDPNSSEPQTFISSPQFLESVKSRDLMWGQQIGVRFAEGFISEKVLGVKTIDTFIQNVT
ncbi:MAG TPA: bacillithiol biosynthesis deacetylase BshB1 [Chitinophagaceae bacterium]|jgi:N-acetylglucosamine malate deacetylase 1|nr:bacillithiol biosynthesis deacetylase BshB1 [Chitinophagaceae bacterium]MBP9739434.1 bacillithiol biosynthesis deacetylase BshB1 [Chitinophagaceae bacterium]HPH22739.1 bacillithiol biosynthesis deacetylase BshB1 [Chitinophagaceae bacterium]